MSKKYASTLAKEYDFKTKEQYYDYIILSLINGNRDQVKNLFNQLRKKDQKDFLNNFLSDCDPDEKECKNICIGELLK